MDVKKKELARLLLERDDFLREFMAMSGLKTTFHIKHLARCIVNLKDEKPNSIFKESNFVWAANWVREDAEKTLKNLEG